MATEKTIQSVPQEQVNLTDDAKTNPVVESATTEVSTQDNESEEKLEVVDFSQEEAELAASAPEYDLGDEIHESEVEHEKLDPAEASQYDFANKTEDELVDLFVNLLESKPVQSLRRDVEAIKIAFYKLHRVRVEQLKKLFVDSGGNVEEFDPPHDPAEVRLKELFADYRGRRDEFLATLEQNKEHNLLIKIKIIDDLKELINSSETINHTFNAFRELQQRWKDTGIVPQANIKDIWETYNLHVENFYNFIKINKELRDLDLKRNYEAKIELCESAEVLLLEPAIVNAFHRLQKLHDQWREIGPVAKEHKEVLWDRFKEASSRINKQHQDYFEGLKDEQKKNYDLKTELCVKTEELLSKVLTSRKEWNKASEKIIEIQKVWKTIGFAPKKENAKVYERFRLACDKFFELKRTYYLQLKAEMEHNLHIKIEICELAESLSASEDWKKTTDELIALQNRWKEVGAVSRRHSDSVWKRFRTACDSFFERKSKHFSSVDSEYDNNLVAKRELLVEMEACDIKTGGFDAIKDFQRRWSEIGFVPIKQKDAIAKRYKEVVDRMFGELRGGEHDRQMDRFKGKVTTLKNSGDRRLKFERERLYNKVKQMESEIALLENNIGFFSNSKNAESMIKDVRAKIARTKSDMEAAIEKINLIDKQE